MTRTTKYEELIIAEIAPRLEAGAERDSVKDALYLRFVQFVRFFGSASLRLVRSSGGV